MVGSKLAAQGFTRPQYFHERPSARSPPTTPAATTFSNLGPTSSALRKQVRTQIRAILTLEGPYNPGLTAGDIPVDAVTTSGSGIDPDISPAYADLQAPRIAAVRHLPLATVQQLISPEHRRPLLGFLGEPGVNVLELNLALDRIGSTDGPAVGKLFSQDIVWPAIKDSFTKLDPRLQPRNPVMFIVEIGSVITTGIFFIDLFRGGTGDLGFVGTIAFWLWLTVLFANFAEAIAEGRGKAQANALRATRTTTVAHAPPRTARIEEVPAPELQRGDVVVVVAGRGDPRRRRRDRGHRLGRRVGHHRRVGAGHPRVGRRPLGGHRRHPAALRPARRRASPRSRASRSSTA